MQKAVQIITRFTRMLFLVPVFLLSLQANSQELLMRKIAISIKNVSPKQALEEIQKAGSTRILFGEDINRFSANIVTITNSAISIKDALELALKRTRLTYELMGNHILIKERGGAAAEQQPVRKQGRVAGVVIDEENGEPVTGVSLRIGNKRAVSAIDGSFSISLPHGVYEVELSSVGYIKKAVSDIAVKEGGLFELNVTLKREKGQLAGVTVKGGARRESVNALYVRQKNNAAISDGISAEQISKTPDKNIGEVLRRVSGVSTMENKYVVVRGLSERYNQAVLNNQVMPSTELNRKNFSFDIIPANIVENVTIVKTLTPDRSAEFGGGLVEVNTIDVPAQDFFNISAGGTYNSNTTGKTFRSLQLDGSEYFGKVASHRNLLGKLNWNSGKEVADLYNSKGMDAGLFSNNWGVYEMKAPVSQNYQVSGGKMFSLNSGRQWGLVGSVTYRNTLQTQDILMSRDKFEDKIDENEPALAGYRGKRYAFLTNIGALAGIGYKTAHNSVGFQALLLRSLDQQLVIGRGKHQDPTGLMLGFYDITNQTSLLQNQLKGEHSLGNKGVKFKWNASYMVLDRHKPDNKQLLALVPSGDKMAETNEFNIGAPMSTFNAGALRWWSRALEKNLTWDGGLSVPFDISAGKLNIRNTIKAGYAGWRKDRMFYVLNTQSEQYDTRDFPPLSEAFTPENNGKISLSNFGDDFHRTADLHGVYMMLDNKLGNKLRLVWGLRAEYFNLNNTNAALDSLFRWINQSRGSDHQYDFSALKNREPDMNFFPSANITYSLTNDMNLRLAYSRSIIRPDLREMSQFREYDFELGGIYSSALVKSTIANHYDFRYEWYPGPGEVLSMSLFYKHFSYPMEIYNDTQSGGMFDLMNNQYIKNYGIELEMRKSLRFTKVPVLRDITVYGNFTALDCYVRPIIDLNMNGVDPGNPNAIIPVEVFGEEVRRPQTGASNYLVNAGLYYDSRPVSLSLLYNYISNRMFRPDAVAHFSVYERPLTSLDAQVAVKVLKQRGELKLNVSNILNRSSLLYENVFNDTEMASGRKQPKTKDLLYQEGTDVIFSQSRPGISYGLSFSYKF